jgi:hypothetical protein
MNGKDAELILKLTEMRMWDKIDDAFIWMYTQYKQIHMKSLKRNILEEQKRENTFQQFVISSNFVVFLY